MGSTVVTVPKTDKDMIAEIAAFVDIPVNFYTIETNSMLLRCEVTTDDPVVIYHFAVMVGFKLGERLVTSVR